jgi:hypothetical protein
VGSPLEENLNVVFKCAWNNRLYRARCDGCPPGITHTCSSQKIHVHIERTEPCWEMNLFNKLEFGSGDNVSIRRTNRDKIAIFTTKKPDLDHRSIIGITRITQIRKHETSTCPHGTFWSDIIMGDHVLFVEIPEKIDINYETWDNRPWRRMLFRYLNDDRVREILITIKSRFQDTGINSNILRKLNELIELVS